MFEINMVLCFLKKEFEFPSFFNTKICNLENLRPAPSVRSKNAEKNETKNGHYDKLNEQFGAPFEICVHQGTLSTILPQFITNGYIFDVLG